MKLSHKEFNRIVDILETDTIRVQIGMASDDEVKELDATKRAVVKALHILATFTDAKV